MQFPPNPQKGQILLIVILVMVVTLTVGLSVVSRSITTLRITKEDETSQRAFSAAEAGIEKIINSSNSSVTGSLTNDASYTTSKSTISGSYLPINGLNAVPKNDGADVWLSTYPNYASPYTGTVTIYWGQNNEVCSGSSSNTQAALEVVVLSGAVSSPVSTHYSLDPCPSRAAVNNFTTNFSSGSVNGKTYPHTYAISVTNGLLMRIIPIYASSIIAVNGSVALPSQGESITSTGTSGETVRKIIVTKGYPRLPVEFFPSAIFSH
ncbi:MAG: hypothetical protein HZC02_00990 [Candidatus Levybacteria bacterium]|nr:hypothetical protein [Candidatus Levybacteria bacterium]